MMFDLTGMTALVTGASGGLGSAIAKALSDATKRRSDFRGFLLDSRCLASLFEWRLSRAGYSCNGHKAVA